MSDPHHPIEASLREHTKNAEFGPPPIDTIVSGGNRRRRRRVAAMATGTVAAVALIAILGWAAASVLGGADSDTPLVGTPSTGPKEPKAPNTTDQSQPDPSATSESVWPPEGVSLTPCADIPRIAEPGAIDDFTVDNQFGILTFSYPTAQGERTVDIAYQRDKHCRDRPDIRQLIERVEDASPN